MTIVEPARAVIGGVDTHLDAHVAAALDPVGGLLGVEEFGTTTAGYEGLLVWLSAFGPVPWEVTAEDADVVGQAAPRPSARRRW